jgi:hypothetical protein
LAQGRRPSTKSATDEPHDGRQVGDSYRGWAECLPPVSERDFNTCRMIIPLATASSQRLHSVANGTGLMIAKTMLLAQA